MSKQEPSTVAAGAEPLASEPGLARALEPGVVVLGGRGLRTRHGGQDPRGETRGRGGRARGDWGSSPFVLPHALPRPSPSRVKCASLSCPAPAHAEGKLRCPLGMPGLRAPGVESPPPLPCFLPPFSASPRRRLVGDRQSLADCPARIATPIATPTVRVHHAQISCRCFARRARRTKRRRWWKRKRRTRIRKKAGEQEEDGEVEGEEEEETEREARGPVPSREPPPPFRRISESVGDDAAAVGSERATSVALLPATLPRRGNRRCQNTWLRQSLDVRPGQVTGFFLGWDRRHDWNYSLSLFFF